MPLSHEPPNRLFESEQRRGITIDDVAIQTDAIHGALIILTDSIHPTESNKVVLTRRKDSSFLQERILQPHSIDRIASIGVFFIDLEPDVYYAHAPQWLLQHLTQFHPTSPGRASIIGGQIGWLYWNDLPEYIPPSSEPDDPRCTHRFYNPNEEYPKGIDLGVSSSTGALLVEFNEGWKNRGATVSISGSGEWRKIVAEVKEYQVNDNKRFSLSFKRRYLAVFPHLKPSEYFLQGPLFESVLGVRVVAGEVSTFDWTEIKVQPPY